MKNVFSAKVEIIIFLFSQNRKCYTSKFSKKWKIIEAET